jgi:putative photosynthetic complex assembly protein
MSTAPFPRGILALAGSAVALSIVAAAVGRLTSDTSAPIEVVAPATNGFLRATMRGLARQRIRQDSDREIPFRLTGWADGRLTLEDPTTGRKVEMEAFGITNEEVFAHLLTARVGS